MTTLSHRAMSRGGVAARRMVRAHGALTMVIASLAASTAFAQETCHIQRVNFCDGCTVVRRITVQKDTGCRFQNSIGAAIHDVKTRVAPRHGVFGKSNETLQAYVPKKGYLGPDYFEYVVFYEDYGKRASTVVQNQVTVTENSPF